MAEDRRKEPNLELPSLFGRKKKQKGEAPPDVDPAASAAPESPAPPAGDTSAEETVRTPAQPTLRPSTDAGRRRPPPPPPPGSGAGTSGGSGASPTSTGPATGATRRPPTPPPTSQPTSGPTSQPSSGPTSQPTSQPAAPAARESARPSEPTAPVAPAPASTAPAARESAPTAPAATESADAPARARGPEFEQPYDPRDDERQDRPVPAAAATTARAPSVPPEGDSRGRRLPWGRKRPEKTETTGSTGTTGSPAAGAPAADPAPAGPGRRRATAPAAGAGAAASARTPERDTDTLTEAPTTTLPAQESPAATTAERAPRRRPQVDPRLGTVLVGVVVGLIGVVLFYLAGVGCNAVRGVNSCGGLGVAALLLVAAVEIVVGATLLKTLGLTDTTSTSFLAVGMVAVIAMAFFFGALGSVWMFLVLPLLTGATFLASWWITTSVVDGVDA